MPIDASIPLQLNQPQFISPAQMIQMRDLVTQSKMRNLQLQEAERQVTTRNALKTVFADPSSRDERGNLKNEALGKIDSIDPEAGMHVRQQLAAQRAQEARTQASLAILTDHQLSAYTRKAEITTGAGTAALTAYKDAVGKGVNEAEARSQAQNVYTEELDKLGKSGFFSEGELRAIPTSFDPQRIEGGVAAGLKAKDYFTIEHQRRQDASKAPTTRTRVQGTSEVQEEWDPKTSSWKQVGGGPRFKPAEDGTGKPPAGYRWKDGKVGAELEAIPGGPATKKVPATTVSEKMNPSMLATVKLDLKELDYGLEQIEQLKAKTAGPFFDEMHGGNALTRIFKKGLTSSEQQEYETLANRFSMAIASVQSMGRGQISDAKIAEARKLVPVPGDSKKNVERKLAVIRRIKEQANEVLSTPLKGGGQSAGEQVQDVLDFWEK